MKKFLARHNRIKSKSAVTAISYGLIAALITVAISGAVYETGNSLNNIFSSTGFVFSYLNAQNAIEQSGLNTPNPALASWQQQEIANALNEVAYGQASLSCLEALNGSDAATMNKVSASCVEGEMGNLAPPALPVRDIGYVGPNGQNWLAAIEQDGTVYAIGQEYGEQGGSVDYLRDGYLDTENGYSCSSPSSTTAAAYPGPVSQVTLRTGSQNANGDLVSCEAPYTGYGNVGALGGSGVTDASGNAMSTSTFAPTNANAQNPLGVASDFSF